MATKTTKRKTTKRQDTKTARTEEMRLWASRYVYSACVLSAGLNGFAGYVEAEGWQILPAVAVNAIVPILAYMLGKVSGLAWQTGRIGIARTIAAIATILLCLSIAHCATALMILTGCGVIAAYAMATVIDAGMLACEYATFAK